MSDGKLMKIIVSIFFVVILIITIATGLFNWWVFFGLFFIGLLYVFGYLYLMNYYMNVKESEALENANKKKFDYCWSRANEMLKDRMPGGQGLEWRSGVGRRSEYRTFYDGVQHRAFRSMEGHLSNSQQLVVVIYDIDNDDIAKYHADPSQAVLEDHFHGFKPVGQRSASPFAGMSKWDKRRYNKYRSGRGVSIHVGNDDEYDDYDNFNSSYTPDNSVVDDTMKKMGGLDGNE